MKKKTKKQQPEKRKNVIVIKIVTFVIFLLLFNYMHKNVKGYTWVFDTMLKNSISVVKKHKDLTISQRKSVRMGYDYSYLNYIKENTPENAIILFPGYDVVSPKDGNTKFKKNNMSASIVAKAWAQSFIYPRQIVYEQEKKTHKLYDSATHVAIINYWGYDKLKYQVDKKVDNAILPISNPPSK